MSSLSCISMNNQPCKARPQLLMLAVIVLYFIHIPLKKVNVVAIVIILMIPMQIYVVKDLSVKVFSLMSRFNEIKK